MKTPAEGREPFRTRYRRSIGLFVWIASVAAIVALYYATIPRSKYATAAVTAAGDRIPTIQVGALPVT